MTPERIGKYRILEPLGRGGMGSVYQGHDPVLDRMVAVKVMTEGGETGTEGRERFLREAQSAARLNHPNIITVYELGEDQGQVFIVMELLEGDPLSRVIGREPTLPLRRKLALMLQICDGLAFAHQRGVVHRDIKPANIFVLGNGQVKILDFGIARLASSDLTRTGHLLGTPSYMSPEQARGRRTDHRSDIFAVGVVFYELLAARKPFVGEDYFEILERVRAEDPPPVGEFAPDLPPALARAVHRALAKDPAARYQTLDELRGDLAAIPDMLPVEDRPEHLREAVDRRFAEVARLHRTLASAVGAAALGEATLPLADSAGAGAGLEAVLRDLEDRTEQLRTLARSVERLEPTVARGIAAFERGAFEEAATVLQAVLKEIPQHQRARDYFDRARIELLREHMVKSFASARPPAVTPARVDAAGGGAERADSGPVPAAAAVAPGSAPGLAAATGRSVTEMTRPAAGRRFGMVLAGVALVALSGGGFFLFRTSPPSVKEPPAALSPAPATPSPPPPSPSGGAPASGAPSGRETSKPPPPAASAPAPPSSPAPRKPATPPAGSTGTAGGGARPALPRLTAEQTKVVEDAVTLAQLFQARGDHERALAEYRRALALDPKNTEARQGAAEAEAVVKAKR